MPPTILHIGNTEILGQPHSHAVCSVSLQEAQPMQTYRKFEFSMSIEIMTIVRAHVGSLPPAPTPWRFSVSLQISYYVHLTKFPPRLKHRLKHTMHRILQFELTDRSESSSAMLCMVADPIS